MPTFTAFCRQADGKGTIWIDVIECIDDVDTARALAQANCANDWDCKWTDVHCIGLAEGDVKVIFWEDD